MRPRAANLMLLAIAVLATGCAQSWTTRQPVTPSTYTTSLAKVPRTAGMLRRLAVLPIEQDLPAICLQGSDDHPRISAPGGEADDMVRYLRDRRGYEGLPLDSTNHRAWLSAPDNRAFVEEITHWSVATDAGTDAGEMTGNLLARLAAEKTFDGLLVLHVRRRCRMANDVERGLMGILTLGFNELWPDPNLLLPYTEYRAAILEAATGRPVWRSYLPVHPLPGDHFQRSAPSDPKLSSSLDRLFESLEPAIPQLLTR